MQLGSSLSARRCSCSENGDDVVAVFVIDVLVFVVVAGLFWDDDDDGGGGRGLFFFIDGPAFVAGGGGPAGGGGGFGDCGMVFPFLCPVSCVGIRIMLRECAT